MKRKKLVIILAFILVIGTALALFLPLVLNKKSHDNHTPSGCIHEFSQQRTVIDERSCTADGLLRYYCKKCDYFEDRVWPKLDHSLVLYSTIQNATCDTNGSATYKCTMCHQYFDKEILKTGHNYITEIVPSTCQVQGSVTRTCTKCGDVQVETLALAPHIYANEYTITIEPTCTTDGRMSRKCINCDVRAYEVVASALDHNFGDDGGGVVTLAPTCTETGEKERTCTRCHETLQYEIEALGHNYEAFFTTDLEPTCTEPGSESRHCSRCDSKTENKTITALGHDWSQDYVTDIAATCYRVGSESKHCSRCDATADSREIPKPQHVFIVTDITEHDHTQTCQNDGCTEVVTSPHIEDSGTITIEPSCVSGEKEFKCTVCERVLRTETLAPTSTHTYTIYVSCTDDEHTFKCSGCELTQTTPHTYDENNWQNIGTQHSQNCTTENCPYVKNEGHSFTVLLNDLTNDTQHTYQCSKCDATEQTNHDFGAWYSVDNTNHAHDCGTCGKQVSEGHDFSVYVSSDENNHIYQCSKCNETSTVAHDFSDGWQPLTENVGSYNKDDYHAKTCKAEDCGYKIYAEHNYIDGICTDCGYSGTKEITLNKNDGSGETTSVIATYGQPMPAITVPTRDCYTFTGYYDSVGEDGTKYYNADGTSARNWDNTDEATALYAHWAENIAYIKYTWRNENAIVPKTDIKTVAFVSTAPSTYDYKTDVSDTAKCPAGLVFAYYVSAASGGYDVKIVAENTLSATIKATSCGMMFKDMSNLQSVDFGGILDTSQVTSMGNMFSCCSSITSINLSSLDTSNLLYTNNMFTDCSSLEEIDFTNFNTSQVTIMNSMFSSCSSLKDLDLSSFNTSNVEEMYEMFDDELKNLNISNWDFSSITSSGEMLNLEHYCGDIRQITALDITLNGLTIECGSSYHDMYLVGGTPIYKEAIDVPGVYIWGEVINYYQDASTLITSTVALYDSVADAPKATLTDCGLAQTGYYVSGWNTKSDYTGDFYAVNTELTVTTPTNLYVVWAAITYTVTYSSNGATGGTEGFPTTQPKTYGEPLTLATANATKTGYHQEGWNTSADGSGTSYACGDSYTNNENVMLYVKWVPNDYVINYVTNGGSWAGGYSVPDRYTYGVGATLPTASNISRANHTFGGWYVSPDFANLPVTSISSTDTGAKTFYAKWTPVTYSITLTQNGGSWAGGYSVPVGYTYGVGVTLPTASNISRANHTFDGWYESSGFTTARVTSISSTDTGNKTFYAKWTLVTYSITLNTNGSDYGSLDATEYTVSPSPQYVTITPPWLNNRHISGYAPSCSGGTPSVENNILTIPANCTGNIDILVAWEACSNYLHMVNFNNTQHQEKCSVCGNLFGQESHTLNQEFDYVHHWDVCSQCDYSSERTVHSKEGVNNGDGTHHFECRYCDFYDGPYSHSIERRQMLIGPEKDEKHIINCYYCDLDENEDHDFSYDLVYESDGTISYEEHMATCQCGYEYRENHVPENELRYDYDVTDNGYSDAVYCRIWIAHCIGCGLLVIESPIEHNWGLDTGTCTRCGKVCSHNWQDNCYDGEPVSLRWNAQFGYPAQDGCQGYLHEDICTICDMHRQNYSFTDITQHSYEDGECYVCGYECPHNWSNGHCSICDYECYHINYKTIGHNTYRCNECGYSSTNLYEFGLH